MRTSTSSTRRPSRVLAPPGAGAGCPGSGSRGSWRTSRRRVRSSRTEHDGRSAGIGELYAINLTPRVGPGPRPSIAARQTTELARLGYREAVLWVVPGNDRARRFYESESGATTRTTRDEVFGVAFLRCDPAPVATSGPGVPRTTRDNATPVAMLRTRESGATDRRRPTLGTHSRSPRTHPRAG